MKAARYYGAEKGVIVEEAPDPTPGEGEVVVRVAACGVCHTDLHYVDHGVPTFHAPPVILGHEISGRIVALGAGVTGWKEGDAVLIPAVLTCGRCRNCREGRENICESMEMLGNHRDGGYAEYIAVPAKDVFRIPEGMDVEEASVIADALSTPYHAVRNRAQVKEGETVLVVGCGGIGLNLVQCAGIKGARVIAVDIRDPPLALARDLGAEDTINISGMEKPEKEIRARTGGGVDVAFEAVGKPATQRLAFLCLKVGGRLCVVGYSAEEVTLPFARLMFFEQSIIGSLGCRPVDYPALISLVHRGKLKVKPLITGRYPLDRLGDAFEALRRGEGIRSLIIP
ncbi:MAG: zinc-binding dehydrogenase [bacterium JZ-2024 1]